MGRTAHFRRCLPGEALRSEKMLPPLENRDPGDETAEEET
jgi:hypothetical protein